MNYTERPKTSAGKNAWDMFSKAIGSAPASMSYGHAGAPTGWQWTAEDKDRSIWVYKANWSHAINVYNSRRYAFAQ
jgi:hypothetical protein